MQKNFILTLIGSILIIIFALTNSAAVSVKLFFWQFEISLALIIFLSAAVGAILTVLFGGIKQFIKSKEMKKITTDNETLIDENHSLQDQKKTLKDENKDIKKELEKLSIENKRLKGENQALLADKNRPSL
ncbi:lipopolysaccharide assembly LapA domain-containing protein [Alkalibaculum bacchi]|uniref:LapA family protein n=1 Tax=Alkalibaculum bacchi TaxID=645887 RepID=UPI0026EBF117|nr:lipopolysaccharide assembly protein LapA domain-containing protein [Alkalibaculum bacchi]